MGGRHAPELMGCMSSVQGREKIELIYTFTEMGFDILVSDVDCVW